ncbi:uncharacterized protein N7458_004618 [Penicillium daleae]|uniref:Uncharacterized protein n=1 Tax=Penicillium daleae TaxID=63821 RepID=A0AAD6C6F5_9EURO|nr:uncharacterized protein N7458_004618 [Penicillium daleae]KAJ5453662.1 hypothetical protein N7458_004618 [Penicillium daleae]
MNRNRYQHVGNIYLNSESSAKNVGYPSHSVTQSLNLLTDVIANVFFGLQIHLRDFFRLSKTPPLCEVI